MKPETIKAIFTNVLFVIGIILVIFGFIRGALTTTRLMVFEKYPLNPYEETKCSYENRPMPIDDQKAISEEEVKNRQDKCEKSLEYDREVKKTEDIVTSIATLVAGAVLVYSFRRR